MAAAIIFDMDGLLIDSEPFWQEAEIQVFGDVGVKLSHLDCQQTMGLRVDEVVEHWLGTESLTPDEKLRITERILSGVSDLVMQRGSALPGVYETVDYFEKKGCRIAVASSSPLFLIKSVLRKLDLLDTFDVTVSAEDEAYGKPHPAVYLKTSRALNISPTACVAIEDSPNGVLSAKAARMKCIAVPDPSLSLDRRFCIADALLPSLEAFSPALGEWILRGH